MLGQCVQAALRVVYQAVAGAKVLDHIFVNLTLRVFVHQQAAVAVHCAMAIVTVVMLVLTLVSKDVLKDIQWQSAEYKVLQNGHMEPNVIITTGHQVHRMRLLVDNGVVQDVLIVAVTTTQTGVHHFLAQADTVLVI